MELSDKPFVMITQVGDTWVWRFAVGGDHGVVGEGDGVCGTRDQAVDEALRAYPGAEVMDVDNPSAAF